MPPRSSGPEYTLELGEFDPSTVLPGSIILAVGRRKTGKTVLLFDVLSHMNKYFDIGVAFCPTLSSRLDFQKIFPETMVYDDLDVDFIGSIIEHQKNCDRRNVPKRQLIMVFDDCMANPKLFNDPIMKDLAMNGRHYFITLIFTCQYLISLPTDFRAQVTYVLCTKEAMPKNQKRLHENYFGMFARVSDFATVLDESTRNYSALVLNNDAVNMVPEECCKWYRAKIDNPPFTIGKRKYWEKERRRKKVALPTIPEEAQESTINDEKNNEAKVEEERERQINEEARAARKRRHGRISSVHKVKRQKIEESTIETDVSSVTPNSVNGSAFIAPLDNTENPPRFIDMTTKQHHYHNQLHNQQHHIQNERQPPCEEYNVETINKFHHPIDKGISTNNNEHNDYNPTLRRSESNKVSFVLPPTQQQQETNNINTRSTVIHNYRLHTPQPHVSSLSMSASQHSNTNPIQHLISTTTTQVDNDAYGRKPSLPVPTKNVKDMHGMYAQSEMAPRRRPHRSVSSHHNQETGHG